MDIFDRTKQDLSHSKQSTRAVGQICLSPAKGGLEMSTLKWAASFESHGYKSYCLSSKHSYIEQEALRKDLSVMAIKHRDYLAPKASVQIRQWLLTNKINRVFLHQLRDLWLVYPALLGLPNIKLYGFARMFISGVNKKDPLHSLLYARFEKLIALTQIQSASLLECLPVPAGKVVVIPNGIDTQRFSLRPKNRSLRQSVGFTDSDFVIGLVGRLDPQKGQLELLQAIHQLRARIPQLRVLLVGGLTTATSAYQDEIKSFLRDAGLEPIVKTLPFQSDIENVYAALDLFCMPSWKENFGNVLVEAMACGIPCIATNSGGAAEILDEGISGSLFRPQDPSDLARVIEHLLSNPAVLKMIASGGRQKAVAQYDLQKVFQAVENLI